MAAIEKVIRVTSETSLPELLDAAAREPIILERHGHRFRLSRDEGIEYTPDPEYVRSILDATLGTLSEDEADRMLRELREAREVGSRKLIRP